MSDDDIPMTAASIIDPLSTLGHALYATEHPQGPEATEATADIAIETRYTCEGCCSIVVWYGDAPSPLAEHQLCATCAWCSTEHRGLPHQEWIALRAMLHSREPRRPRP